MFVLLLGSLKAIERKRERVCVCVYTTLLNLTNSIIYLGFTVGAVIGVSWLAQPYNIPVFLAESGYLRHSTFFLCIWAHASACLALYMVPST